MPEQAATLYLQSLFLFAMVWSTGGNTNLSGRSTFEGYFRKLVAGEAVPELEPYMSGPFIKLPGMPEAQSIYSYSFDVAKARWTLWLDTVPPMSIDPEAEYSSVIV